MHGAVIKAPNVHRALSAIVEREEEIKEEISGSKKVITIASVMSATPFQLGVRRTATHGVIGQRGKAGDVAPPLFTPGALSFLIIWKV